MKTERRSVYCACLALLALLASGCLSVAARNPVPAELVEIAVVPNIPDARMWGDQPPSFAEEWFAQSDGVVRERYLGVYGTEHHYLAVSGGGANGAFGAGLLAGWTAAGTRPEFTRVTGVSTGALIAPFAFLGSEYDRQLEEVYTEYSTQDLLKKRNMLRAMLSDAMYETEPLRAIIAKYVDQELLDAIAEKHRKGFRLMIGTTNLDASRPVIWDIGAIASSDHPNALELVHSVLLASASIPAAFPPVLFEVEANGGSYNELHVDGGAVSQVFLFPTGLNWRRVVDKLHVPGTPKVYVIRNAKLEPTTGVVNRKLPPIAFHTISSLIRTQGFGDMYRIYLETLRDGFDYNLAYIPEEFEETPAEMFDPEYMRKLYDVGYALARSGDPWQTTPPGFERNGEAHVTGE